MHMEYEDHLSVEEIKFRLGSLPLPEWRRLQKAAHYITLNKSLDAEDLMQITFRRLLDTENYSRRCPRDVDFMPFLIQTMKGIASDEQDKVMRRPQKQSYDLIVEEGQEGVIASTHTHTPEQLLAKAQELNLIGGEILAIFEDDKTAQALVTGMLAGEEGEALRKQTSLDNRDYQSKRKLIRRRINKRFPKGWEM